MRESRPEIQNFQARISSSVSRDIGSPHIKSKKGIFKSFKEMFSKYYLDKKGLLKIK